MSTTSTEGNSTLRLESMLTLAFELIFGIFAIKKEIDGFMSDIYVMLIYGRWELNSREIPNEISK
jgi:hypothetical protein